MVTPTKQAAEIKGWFDQLGAEEKGLGRLAIPQDLRRTIGKARSKLDTVDKEKLEDFVVTFLADKFEPRLKKRIDQIEQELRLFSNDKEAIKKFIEELRAELPAILDPDSAREAALSIEKAYVEFRDKLIEKRKAGNAVRERAITVLGELIQKAKNPVEEVVTAFNQLDRGLKKNQNYEDLDSGIANHLLATKEKCYQEAELHFKEYLSGKGNLNNLVEKLKLLKVSFNQYEQSLQAASSVLKQGQRHDNSIIQEYRSRALQSFSEEVNKSMRSPASVMNKTAELSIKVYKFKMIDQYARRIAELLNEQNLKPEDQMKIVSIIANVYQNYRNYRGFETIHQGNPNEAEDRNAIGAKTALLELAEQNQTIGVKTFFKSKVIGDPAFGKKVLECISDLDKIYQESLKPSASIKSLETKPPPLSPAP